VSAHFTDAEFKHECLGQRLYAGQERREREMDRWELEGAQRVSLSGRTPSLSLSLLKMHLERHLRDIPFATTMSADKRCDVTCVRHSCVLTSVSVVLRLAYLLIAEFPPPSFPLHAVLSRTCLQLRCVSPLSVANFVHFLVRKHSFACGRHYSYQSATVLYYGTIQADLLATLTCFS
jgi:hypothetical protein